MRQPYRKVNQIILARLMVISCYLPVVLNRVLLIYTPTQSGTLACEWILS